MSRKSKLVFKITTHSGFELAKAVNTLDHGVPGEIFCRKDIDRLLIDNQLKIKRGELVVEFLKGGT